MLDDIIYVKIPVLGQEISVRFEVVGDLSTFYRRIDKDDADIFIKVNNLYHHTISTFWNLLHTVESTFSRDASSCVVKATEIEAPVLCKGEYYEDFTLIRILCVTMRAVQCTW
jgi:hypothetical protein